MTEEPETKDGKEKKTGLAEGNDRTLDSLIKQSTILLNGLRYSVTEEWCEENLDQDTLLKIVEVCGGVNLTDPNLMAAAAAMTDQ